MPSGRTSLMVTSRSVSSAVDSIHRLALAGPANRQGRIAAEVIAGRDSRFRGTQGTSICQIFEGVIAQTGVSEKTLKRLEDTDYEKIYLYPNSPAGYYPGAKYIAMKVLFRKSDGRLLGAQMLGEDGVPKRIDSFAMAIQAGFTIYDLEESELSYAPPFGSAKDPVNFAGMIAVDILRDDMPLSHWDTVEGGFLLDVRQPAELTVEHVPGAVNIVSCSPSPLGDLLIKNYYALEDNPKLASILVGFNMSLPFYFFTAVKRRPSTHFF